MADQFSSNRDFYEAMLEEKRRREEEQQNAENPPGTEELEDPAAFDVSEEGEEAHRVQEQNLVEKDKIVADPPEEAVPVVEEKAPEPVPEKKPVEKKAPAKEAARGPAEEKKESFLESPAYVEATAKENADRLLDYFAGQFAFESRTDGTNFLKDEILLVEEDKDTFAREYSQNEQRRLFRSMLEEKTLLRGEDGKTLVDEFKEIPEEIFRGVVLRNLKSMEDFANELSGDRFTFGFAPEFEDEESFVADVAEAVPLIAASFTPAGLVARGLQASRWGMRLYKVASAALPRKLLPAGLKMLSSASTYSAFQSMKAAVKRDENGNPIAPAHPYGSLASVVITETPEEAKARMQAYRQGDLWERFMAQAKGVTVDEIALEAALLGTGALALKGGKAVYPLLKTRTTEILTPLLQRTQFERGAKLKALKEHRHLRDFERLKDLESAEFLRMVEADEIPDEIFKGYLNYTAKQQYQKNLDFLNSYQEWTMMQISGRKKIVDRDRIIEIQERPAALISQKAAKRQDIATPKKKSLADLQATIGRLSGAARINKKRLAEATEEYLTILDKEDVPRTQLSAAMKAIGQDSRISSVEILRLQSQLSGKKKPDDLLKKRIARLKNKKRNLDEIYRKTKANVKASPDVIEEQEALERLLSHENLGQTAERLKKIPGSDQEEMFELMEGLAKGEIAPGDVKIYQSISKSMSFAKAMDIVQKTSIGTMLSVTALQKAILGNFMETAVRKGVVAGKTGFTSAPGRTWRGLSNVAKLGAARLRSRDYLEQSWETMRGVRTSQAFTERNLPYAGVQPMSAGPLEQGLNVVPGATFKALEVLDEVSTAFNSPEIVESVLFDLAARTSKDGRALKGVAQARMAELAQQINKKLAAGDTKDPLVKEFLDLSSEESKRLAFRADVTKDPDAYSLIKKAAAFAQGSVAKRMDDKWHTTLGKTFLQTTIFPFANTGINIAYRNAESLQGAAMFAAGKAFKRGGLTAAERNRMLDAATRNAIALGLITYALNADNPLFDYRPSRPNEEARTLRDMGSTTLSPSDIKLGEGTIGKDALGPTATWLTLQAEMALWAQTAAENGDDAFGEAVLKASSEVTRSAIPGQVFENIADVMRGLDPEKTGTATRFWEGLARESVQKAMPGVAMAKRYRQGKEEGVFSKIGVPERPSESFFTGGAAEKFKNAHAYLGAFFKSAYGVEGAWQYDLFGNRVNSFFGATKDDAWTTVLPVSSKGAPTKEAVAKYQALTIFASEMGLLGQGDDADTDEAHPLGAQDVPSSLRFQRPSASITVRRKTIRFKADSQEKEIDDSQTASVALAPQHQNFMRSLVGQRSDRWDELQELIGSHSEEDLGTFLEIRQDFYALWNEWGANPEKEGLADIMAKIVEASPKEIEELNPVEARYAWEEVVYAGLEPNLEKAADYEELKEEQLRQVKAIMLVELYNGAHKLAKEAMGLHPEYQDDSPALRAFEREQEEESARLRGEVPNPAI